MDIRSVLKGWEEAVLRYDKSHNFTCDVCGREVFGGERICASCDKALPKNDGNVCPLCGRKVGEEGICLECKAKRPVVDKARSAFLHEREAARLVLRFKRGEKYLSDALVRRLYPIAAEAFPDADAVTFVPMTARAEKARGYNQSYLLAKELAGLWDKELLSVAVKQRETEAQKTLTARERAENLKGCFHIRDRKGVRGKKIVIADDTMTTGATADELASALKRAGAAKVYLVTVTSVPKKDPFGKPSA